LIVYVNGDSHSAGAEAVNTFCFADDDPRYRELGRRPHPDNLAVSYGQILANKFNAELVAMPKVAVVIPASYAQHINT